MNMSKKRFVISGINLFSGGPLSVYKDLLHAIEDGGFLDQFHVTAFVHKKELFKEFEGNIELIEIPSSRKSYFFRLYYEYIYFWNYSRKNPTDVWLSIHDMTPNVKAKKRYVYCHNPSPFMKRTETIRKLGKTYYLMSMFYKFIYRINIRKNTAVIVQQEWLRKEFRKMFRLDHIIVARPDFKLDSVETSGISEARHDRKIFIYSAYPRPFKNFEAICEAAKLLEEKDQAFADKFEVWMTIDGSENPYSEMLRQKYGNIRSIRWLGLISRDEMMRKYAESDYLIFPSVLETWGLPITEYKMFDKPMLVADLPYAHETVGDWDKVAFFDPYQASQLSEQMEKVLSGANIFRKHVEEPVEQPFTNSWHDLLKMILKE